MWTSTASLLALALSAIPQISAQTYSNCNPLQQTCPANPALGKSVKIDFSSASDQFTTIGTVNYGSDGASFTVAKSGDTAQLNSKWYIMFGKVTWTVKAAPGQGMVSSMVLQSDDLDEIDWEFVGSQTTSAQSNYFGKGVTGSYNRGGNHVLTSGTTTGEFHTYTVDWTSEQVVWQIDGSTVRVLKYSDAAENQYPQSPMQVRIGAWAGGDPSNSPGTIEWAGGAIDYSQGPFTMYLKSMEVTDYSTGSEYSYDGTSGSWQSIRSNGGSINGNADGSSSTEVSGTTAVSTTNSVPDQGCTGWKACDSSSTNREGWPWTGSTTTLATLASPTASISGLPSGWTSSPQPSPVSSVSSPSPAQSLAGPLETVTRFDQQGFATVVCVNPSDSTYDGNGNLVTQPCAGAAAPAPTTTTGAGIAEAADAVEGNAPSSTTPLIYAETNPALFDSANAGATISSAGRSAFFALFMGFIGAIGMVIL